MWRRGQRRNSSSVCVRARAHAASALDGCAGMLHRFVHQRQPGEGMADAQPFPSGSDVHTQGPGNPVRTGVCAGERPGAGTVERDQCCDQAVTAAMQQRRRGHVLRLQLAWRDACGCTGTAHHRVWRGRVHRRVNPTHSAVRTSGTGQVAPGQVAPRTVGPEMAAPEQWRAEQTWDLPPGMSTNPRRGFRREAGKGAE